MTFSGLRWFTCRHVQTAGQARLTLRILTGCSSAKETNQIKVNELSIMPECSWLPKWRHTMVQTYLLQNTCWLATKCKEAAQKCSLPRNTFWWLPPWTCAGQEPVPPPASECKPGCTIVSAQGLCLTQTHQLSDDHGRCHGKSQFQPPLPSPVTEKKNYVCYWLSNWVLIFNTPVNLKGYIRIKQKSSNQ